MGGFIKSVTKQDLEKLPHKFQVAFAIFCAKQTLHLVSEKDKEVCTKAIFTSELWLEDKATDEECTAAAYAVARDANATADAARAAYTAANAAANAANAAYTAANAAAARAAYTAANAAANAANAAYTAANAAAANAANSSEEEEEQIVEAQWVYYNELLNFDSIVDTQLLN